MQCLQKLLAGVFLFSAAANAVATADEAASGKVKGFTGPAGTKLTADSKIFKSGDFLTATLCYCLYPEERMTSAMGPGHWYQFEYYNIHRNTTFILTSACPDGDIGFDKSCLPSYGSRGLHLVGDGMEQNCKLWETYERTDGNHLRKRRDEFCYMPEHTRGHDFMSFNKQKRNLDENGHQGPVFIQDSEIDDICEDMCQENMDMSAARPNVCRQVVWTELDDMCDQCRKEA